jgi:hypothetical protein
LKVVGKTPTLKPLEPLHHLDFLAQVSQRGVRGVDASRQRPRVPQQRFHAVLEQRLGQVRAAAHQVSHLRATRRRGGSSEVTGADTKLSHDEKKYTSQLSKSKWAATG